jgi:hypothetical protein
MYNTLTATHTHTHLYSAFDDTIRLCDIYYTVRGIYECARMRMRVHLGYIYTHQSYI